MHVYIYIYVCMYIYIYSVLPLDLPYANLQSKMIPWPIKTCSIPCICILHDTLSDISYHIIFPSRSVGIGQNQPLTSIVKTKKMKRNCPGSHPHPRYPSSTSSIPNERAFIEAFAAGKPSFRRKKKQVESDVVPRWFPRPHGLLSEEVCDGFVEGFRPRLGRLNLWLVV